MPLVLIPIKIIMVLISIKIIMVIPILIPTICFSSYKIKAKSSHLIKNNLKPLLTLLEITLQ